MLRRKVKLIAIFLLLICFIIIPANQTQAAFPLAIPAVGGLVLTALLALGFSVQHPTAARAMVQDCWNFISEHARSLFNRQAGKNSVIIDATTENELKNYIRNTMEYEEGRVIRYDEDFLDLDNITSGYSQQLEFYEQKGRLQFRFVPNAVGTTKCRLNLKGTTTGYLEIEQVHSGGWKRITRLYKGSTLVYESPLYADFPVTDLDNRDGKLILRLGAYEFVDENWDCVYGDISITHTSSYCDLVKFAGTVSYQFSKDDIVYNEYYIYNEYHTIANKEIGIDDGTGEFLDVTNIDALVEKGIDDVIMQDLPTTPTEELGWLGSVANILSNIYSKVAGIPGTLANISDAVRSLPQTLADNMVGELGEITFEPLKNVFGQVTTVFPFSLPWDLRRLAGALEVPVSSWSDVAEIDLKFPNGNGGTIDFKINLPDSLSRFIPYIRWMFLIIFDIGMIFSIRKLLGGAV